MRLENYYALADSNIGPSATGGVLKLQTTIRNGERCLSKKMHGPPVTDIRYLSAHI